MHVFILVTKQIITSGLLVDSPRECRQVSFQNKSKTFSGCLPLSSSTQQFAGVFAEVFGGGLGEEEGKVAFGSGHADVEEAGFVGFLGVFKFFDVGDDDGVVLKAFVALDGGELDLVGDGLGALVDVVVFEATYDGIFVFEKG